MLTLHDAAGGQAWITVTEDNGCRYLYLDGCEEGAMSLASHAPVFHYLWFHKFSHLALSPVRHALVLGAGAFTAPKCLALDHPLAIIDAVDCEPLLGEMGVRYFGLDRSCFARVRFHGTQAEDYLAGPCPRYEFIFDDLFDGFQHVPTAGRGQEHADRLQSVLAEGGIVVKNLIWDSRRADSRSACEEAWQAWQAFPSAMQLVLGEPDTGHNRILIAQNAPCRWDWSEIRSRLAAAGVPVTILDQVRPV
jgi:spermidine synthase